MEFQESIESTKAHLFWMFLSSLYLGIHVRSSVKFVCWLVVAHKATYLTHYWIQAKRMTATQSEYDIDFWIVECERVSKEEKDIPITTSNSMNIFTEINLMRIFRKVGTLVKVESLALYTKLFYRIEFIGISLAMAWAYVTVYVYIFRWLFFFFLIFLLFLQHFNTVLSIRK